MKRTPEKRSFFTLSTHYKRLFHDVEIEPKRSHDQQQQEIIGLFLTLY